jgi:hypothetical protein
MRRSSFTIAKTWRRYYRKMTTFADFAIVPDTRDRVG